MQQQHLSGAMIESLSGRMGAIDDKLGTLLPSPVQAPTTAPPPVSTCEPDFRPAELFDGDLDKCGGFLFQCKLAFEQSPSWFPDQLSKITYVVNTSKVSALRCAHVFLQTHSCETLTYQRFLQEFRWVFDHLLQQEGASKHLLALRQGKKTVANHSVDFWITTEESGWDDQALKGVFVNSLSDVLKDQLATCDEPDSLDGLINMVVTSR